MRRRRSGSSLDTPGFPWLFLKEARVSPEKVPAAEALQGEKPLPEPAGPAGKPLHDADAAERYGRPGQVLPHRRPARAAHDQGNAADLPGPPKAELPPERPGRRPCLAFPD